MSRCPVFKKWQIEAMRHMIREGSLLEREFGVDLIKGETGFGEHCSGDECSVNIEPHPESYGYFHNHPSGLLNPSVNDYAAAVWNNQQTICVGGMVDDSPKIRCEVVDGKLHHQMMYDDAKNALAVMGFGKEKFRGRHQWRFFNRAEAGWFKGIVKQAFNVECIYTMDDLKQ